MYTFASPVKCVFEPSKENKSKTINARRKTRTVLEFRTKLRTPISDFRLFLMIEDFQIKLQLLIFSPDINLKIKSKIGI